MTGILDRLERGSWIARDRDPADRRAVVIRILPDRNAEMFRLYSGMKSRMDDICASYDDAQLEVIIDFLRRVQAAGSTASKGTRRRLRSRIAREKNGNAYCIECEA